VWIGDVILIVFVRFFETVYTFFTYSRSRLWWRVYIPVSVSILRPSHQPSPRTVYGLWTRCCIAALQPVPSSAPTTAAWSHSRSERRADALGGRCRQTTSQTSFQSPGRSSCLSVQHIYTSVYKKNKTNYFLA